MSPHEWTPRLARAILIATLFVSACATNPATGKREVSFMSEEKEIQIGVEQDGQIRKEMGFYSDQALQQYVSGIGLRLAAVSERPSLPWHYTVVDAPAVNAFALPGGYIYVTRGILPYLDDEAQLAGVLGHETGHVTARHASQQYSRSTGAEVGLLLGSILVPQTRPLAGLGQNGLGVLMLKYGRDDEAQADALGVRYASRAGWDPAGVPQLLTTLGRIEEASDTKGVPNWLQTHPGAEDRVQRVQTAVRDAETGATQFTTNRDDYLKRIDGVIWGDSPEQGVVRGNRFWHAGLRLSVDFPQGWDITNGQRQVIAKQPGMKALVLLQTVQRPMGRGIDEIAQRSMEGAGLRIVDGNRSTINGLDAFIGTYEGSLQSLGRVTIRAAHIMRDRDIWLLAGIAPQDAYAGVEPEFSKSVTSFRALTSGEAEGIRPNRVRLYSGRQGDTWQSIAERESHGSVKATTLAIMNGRVVTDQPRPGERLKIVVGG